MTIKKQDDGRYLVMVRPDGRAGKNIRRLANSKSEAVRLERELLYAKVADFDRKKLSFLVSYWFDHFGVNLKDGKSRKSKLDHIVLGLGDRSYSSFKPVHYLNYRRQRLDSGISKNTCNHDLVYLKAVFNRLVKLGCLTGNPLSDIAPLKLDEYEMSFLSVYQIKRLLVACRQSSNESLFPVVCVCLSTGARWSEVENLLVSQLHFDQVRFVKTKNGKSRTVPLDHDLYVYLRKRMVWGKGRIFANCLSAFRGAVKRAKIQLPKGQMSHVLRHTFASHFVMNGGDILTLQKILGHSDVKVTMRYAHLSPDHLKDAIELNPLSRMRKT